MNNNFNGIGMTSQRARDRLIQRLREMGIRDERILAAMQKIPRHIFIDEALSSRAYENTALPIGYSQTISQPYIVARMTEALLQGSTMHRVLEIGTGCGYQTVLLANLIERVYTIERINALLIRAREHFHSLGLRNIRTKHADGNIGWPEQGPFDGILVTAAPVGIPQKLLDQLAPGGRLLIPVGRAGEQRLLAVTRTQDGFEETSLDMVSFVPMLQGLV